MAAGLSLIPQTMLGRPDLAGVLLILLLLRIVNRTVGPAAQPLDTIGILTLVGVAIWRGQPVLALAAAGAFVLDQIDVAMQRAVPPTAVLVIGMIPAVIGPVADAYDNVERTIAVDVRIDTPVELDYYRNQGILQTVLRKLLVS